MEAEAEPGRSFQHHPLPVIFLQPTCMFFLRFVQEFAVFRVQLSDLGLIIFSLKLLIHWRLCTKSKEVRVQGHPQ